MSALQAAIDVARAADNMRLLHQVQRATGRQLVTETDQLRLEEAVARFGGVSSRRSRRGGWHR